MFHCLVIKVVSLSFLCDSLFILPHLILFVKNFFKFFSKTFSIKFFVFVDDLSTLSQVGSFVNHFFNFLKFKIQKKLKTEKEGFEPSRRVNDLYP